MTVVPTLWARLPMLTLCYAVASTFLQQLDWASVAAAQPPAETADRLETSAERARAIEGRLRAPCCWTQTIDVHDSEIARELHREIVSRLEAGEPSKLIEDALVARYGERLRAVPAGNPLYDVALLVAFVVALAAVALFFRARRWRQISDPSKDATDLGGELDEYDEVLRRELAELT